MTVKALITGAGGLIGSACARMLASQGWEVVGLDNDMRQAFFGPAGSTASVLLELTSTLSRFRHISADIRDRQLLRDLLKGERPQFIIHTAGQPSHDKAAAIPYEDFDINAVGTLNLLVACRDFCPEAPFCFTSTNKVYGDRPNSLALVERETRYDYANGIAGVDEGMSIDACLHSLFGASKVAADVLAQEFGRYFNMPVGIFRCGCVTGPQHAAVEAHGYLAYIVSCAVTGKEYTVFGYKGKQVRDQIHCDDVASLFLEFYKKPRNGDVYNLGGGRENSISVLETIAALGGMGHKLRYRFREDHRVGDHICYISALNKIRAHFPDWRMKYDVVACIEQIVRRFADARRQPAGLPAH
ncbi:MAG TPA: NAD-dependent epimerase/dehydratase family protein [Gemmataceae bacterium]|jgi:CDP-paratose 2-epimerase|nr:NAD-dependent epimerase/dehydratase family protein [Gemmataceae bacterium]